MGSQSEELRSPGGAAPPFLARVACYWVGTARRDRTPWCCLKLLAWPPRSYSPVVVGFGFRVWGLGFRVRPSGLRGLGVWGFRVWGLGFRVFGGLGV